MIVLLMGEERMFDESEEGVVVVNDVLDSSLSGRVVGTNRNP
jgi:hypothetical protein